MRLKKHPPFLTEYIHINGTHHTLYVAHYGTPNGVPAIFLHGGPGSYINDDSVDAFNLEVWHVVAFDQRGCGRSTPRNSLKHNTPQATIEDIEHLRKRCFNKQQVVLVGGSYGSLLAILYAVKYAKRLCAVVVRGIYYGEFTVNPSDERIKTQAWRQLQHITRRRTFKGITNYTAKRLSKRQDRLLTRTWYRFEQEGLVSNPLDLKGTAWANPNDTNLYTSALFEAHFKSHGYWLNGGTDALLKAAAKALRFARVPCVILHGEMDMICPVANARRLYAVLDDGSGRVQLRIVKGAAHSSLDHKNAIVMRESIRQVYVDIVNQTWKQCINKCPSKTKCTENATFGIGCFWGAELFLQRLPGVCSTRVGYMGGHLKNPTYKEVCIGNTGHAEVVDLQFDPAVLSYKALLKKIWEFHDPTTLNRQGNDKGTQYRSVIFYYNPRQQKQAIASMAYEQKRRKARITTQLLNGHVHIFYQAENYHQQYLEKGGQDSSKGATVPISCYGK